MTPAQLRALLWLPEDGEWTTAPRDITAAIKSLELYHRDLVVSDWGWSCGRSPLGRLHYKLTAAGIAEQARRKRTAQ